jgi:CHAT domain-containing protein
LPRLTGYIIGVAAPTPFNSPEEVASKLVASTRTTRRRAIARLPAESLFPVTLALKDICYETWNSEPVTAQRADETAAEIVKISEHREIAAIADWIRGIANITRGKLEAAVEDLESSAQRYRSLRMATESAQPRVAQLIALAMLGRYEEAARAGRIALTAFKKAGDELAAGKIELNLSNISARRERHREAERLGHSALLRFKQLGLREWQTMAENDLANTYADLCELSKADGYYRSALEHAEAAGMTVTAAEIEASIGNLARSRGRYDEALRRLESSRDKYERLGMPHQSAIAELEIADIYSELNLAQEALESYKSLVKRLRRLKLRSEEARARSNYARVLLSTGEYRKAMRQLRASLEILRAEGNTAGSALTLLRIANAEIDRGMLVAANENVGEAEMLLRKANSPRYTMYASLLSAELMTTEGKLAAAINKLSRLLAESEKLGDPTTSIAALSSLGRAAIQKGDLVTAEERLEKAVVMIESLREPLPGEEFRRSFVADKLGPFDRLVGILIRQERFRKAFQTVERSRARSLTEMIESHTAGSAKSASDDDAETRERLNWIYRQMDNAAADDRPTLSRDAGRLEKKLAALKRRSSSRSLIGRSQASALDVSEVQQRLGSKLVLTEYIQIGDRISAFVITDREIHFAPDLATSNEITALLQDLHFQFAPLRMGAAALGGFAGALRAKADAVLQKLYRALVEPVIEIVGRKDLLISPAGQLNLVPFGALFDGTTYLASSREIVLTPSAGAWLSLYRRPKRKISPAVLIGYADAKIPLVEHEITALRKLIPESHDYLGADATFSRFNDEAGDAGLLHLACHGRYRPDNPMYSSLHFADGWVTAADTMDMRLRAELVTLSACETGVSKVYPGEEGVGLARGFLGGGASNVMLSLWAVNDSAAAELMVEFYNELQRGLSPAASLRKAQQSFIDRGDHPYLWAPFVLIGR